MNIAVREQFNDEILAAIVRHWGGTVAQLRFVQDTGNLIYAIEPAGGPRTFLRISPDHEPDQVQAELDWVLYLKRHGMNVAAPLESENGRFLHTHPADGGQFTAVCFTEAPGQRLAAEQWTDEHIHQLGRFVGKLNRLSQTYQPPVGQPTRHTWDVQQPPKTLAAELPAKDQAAQKMVQQLTQQFAKFPRSKENFGLIHADIHAGNFFFDENQFHLFDFDDCCYHWFACDVAHVLYYALWRIPRDAAQERADFAAHFFPLLLAGYSQENQLDSEWLKLVPALMEYRDLMVYGFVNGRFGKDAPPNFIALRNAISNRLAAGQPYVNFQP